MTRQDDDRQGIGWIARGWWSGLQPHAGRGGNSGALARLRRADLFDAAMEEATNDLFHRLAPGSKLRRETLFERAALLAAVLAHVREDDNRRVAAAAGEKHGEQRVLHPLRVRRLFAARSASDCLVAFRRLVALLGKKANVADLADSLMDWPDQHRGDRCRTRWAFDYYGAHAAAPQDQDQAAA